MHNKKCPKTFHQQPPLPHHHKIYFDTFLKISIFQPKKMFVWKKLGGLHPKFPCNYQEKSSCSCSKEMFFVLSWKNHLYLSEEKAIFQIKIVFYNEEKADNFLLFYGYSKALGFCDVRNHPEFHPHSGLKFLLAWFKVWSGMMAGDLDFELLGFKIIKSTVQIFRSHSGSYFHLLAWSKVWCSMRKENQKFSLCRSEKKPHSRKISVQKNLLDLEKK